MHSLPGKMEEGLSPQHPETQREKPVSDQAITSMLERTQLIRTERTLGNRTHSVSSRSSLIQIGY